MVIILTDWNPSVAYYGGDITYIRAHAEAAHNAGCDVHLLTASDCDNSPQLPYGQRHHLHTHRRFLKSMWLPFISRSLIRKAVAVVEQHRNSADQTCIIHSFNTASTTGVLIARKLRKTGINAYTICNCYSTYVDEKISQWQGARLYSVRDRLINSALVVWAVSFMHWWEKFGIRQSDLVLVNYNCIADSIHRLHGNATVRKIRYWNRPPTTSQAVLPRSGSKTRSSHLPTILCVSRHDSRKGISTLLDALVILDRQGVVFRAEIVSSGPLLGHHHQRVRELGLQEKVTLPGFMTNLSDYYQTASIFVLPSHREQSGSVSLLEAMRAGVASISSACDGMVEDVIDGNNGLLVPPNDAEALATSLRRLLQDKDLRKRIARAAVTSISTDYSLVALQHDLISQYRRVVD